MTESRQHLVLLASFLAILVWSGIAPKDHFIWFLEVFPAMAAAVVLVAIYPRIRLTMLVYCLIWLHALVLVLGGHWTYAEMPLFNWLRDEFGLARNYYDRVGHFFQGFVPAMIAREIFLRSRVVNGRGWMFFLVCCDIRVLRIDRMVGRGRLGHRRRRLPRHPGRRVGYAVGHVHRAVRRDRRADHAGGVARSAVAGSRRES
jgi:uncharacterized membrane protein YjdF